MEKFEAENGNRANRQCHQRGIRQMSEPDETTDTTDTIEVDCWSPRFPSDYQALYPGNIGPMQRYYTNTLTSTITYTVPSVFLDPRENMKGSTVIQTLVIQPNSVVEHQRNSGLSKHHVWDTITVRPRCRKPILVDESLVEGE